PIENLCVANCHCFGGNTFTEMKCETVMGIVAGVEIARRGQINEPTEVAWESCESAIPQVCHRRLNFDVFGSKAHVSALTLTISCSNVPRSHAMVRRVWPTILRVRTGPRSQIQAIKRSHKMRTTR